jgi:hypothetical protein
MNTEYGIGGVRQAVMVISSMQWRTTACRSPEFFCRQAQIGFSTGPHWISTDIADIAIDNSFVLA